MFSPTDLALEIANILCSQHWQQYVQCGWWLSVFLSHQTILVREFLPWQLNFLCIFSFVTGSAGISCCSSLLVHRPVPARLRSLKLPGIISSTADERPRSFVCKTIFTGCGSLRENPIGEWEAFSYTFSHHPACFVWNLTFYTLRLTLCTTNCNIQTFSVLPTMHLFMLCGSENKQWLFTV